MLFDFSIQTTLVTFQLKQMEVKSEHFVTVYGKTVHTQWVLNHIVIYRNGWISCSITCVLFLSEIWLFTRMVGSWLRDRIRLTWSKPASVSLITWLIPMTVTANVIHLSTISVRGSVVHRPTHISDICGTTSAPEVA